LGRTGERVSIIGLGGFHIGMMEEEDEAIEIIHRAIDLGITFFDNCWDYNDGESERRLGKALQGGRRDKVFLMTKIDGRNRRAAEAQIDQSLRRLRTDVVDLMQVHEVIRESDPERIFAPGGTLEALLAARDAGKIRYIGFTGHKDPSLHLRMLELADSNGFSFDAVQMPLNVMDPHAAEAGAAANGSVGDEGSGRRASARERGGDCQGVSALRALVTHRRSHHWDRQRGHARPGDRGGPRLRADVER
jgi:aryl-alcohol dehydrogenase-like predicted oxidoreductase